MNSSYLSVREIAMKLSVTPAHIYNLVKLGIIPAVRLGKTVRIKETDLEDYIKTHSTVPACGTVEPTVTGRRS